MDPSNLSKLWKRYGVDLKAIWRKFNLNIGYRQYDRDIPKVYIIGASWFISILIYDYVKQNE